MRKFLSLLALIFITSLAVGQEEKKDFFYSLEEAFKHPEDVRFLMLSEQNLGQIPDSIGMFLNLENHNLKK